MLGQPVRSLHRGFEAGLEIIFHIGVHQSRNDFGSQIFVGIAVAHLDDARIGSQRDLQVAFDSGQQDGGSRRIGLQRIRSEVERGGQSHRVSTELGTPVQTQFLDHLQGKQIALQNLDFGLQFRGIVIVQVKRGRIVEIDQAGIRFIDGDAAAGFVNGGHLEAGDGDYGEDRQQTGENRPFALHQDADVFAECRFLRERFGIDAWADGSSEFRVRCRLHLASVIGLNQRSGIHALSSVWFADPQKVRTGPCDNNPTTGGARLVRGTGTF